MKNGFLSAAVFAAASIVFADSAHAAVATSWTFETAPPADVSAASIGPLAADMGIGSATGVHASGTTAWTTPAGNGSANSLSANSYAVGDYFQFETSTLGTSDIGITFDQTGSNTGPRDWQFAYSTDGTNFTNVGPAYSLINGAWSAPTPVATTSFSYDLSSIAAVENDSSVFFRLSVVSNTSINGGTVAATGTGRVDNFTVSNGVPEPTGLGVIGLAGIVGLRRRGRRQP
jgi:MYXO-CTERM domain-containing protein